MALYRRGLLKPAKLPFPVISVGNITAGGTGKTPLVEYLAHAIADAGFTVCILTRGYGRENPGRRVLVSDAVTVFATEPEAGDEPLLLAKKLRGVAAVICDADRFAAGQWAVDNLNSTVFILDDGFQHLQLARDLNVVTIDATDPWGGGHLLPRGRLREPARGLSRADLIVITRADQSTKLDLLKDEIRELANRPLLISRMVVRGLRELGNSAAAQKMQIDKPVAAFSAIGNQDAFVRQLEAEGIEIVRVSTFRDHHRYTQREIDDIVASAKDAGAHALITTEKDAVKLEHISLTFPCYVVDIQIQIDNAQCLVDMLREAIRSAA